MKKIIAFLFICISIGAHAQDVMPGTIPPNVSYPNTTNLENPFSGPSIFSGTNTLHRSKPGDGILTEKYIADDLQAKVDSLENVLKRIKDILKGVSPTEVNMSTKWDANIQRLFDLGTKYNDVEKRIKILEEEMQVFVNKINDMEIRERNSSGSNIDPTFNQLPNRRLTPRGKMYNLKGELVPYSDTVPLSNKN